MVTNTAPICFMTKNKFGHNTKLHLLCGYLIYFLQTGNPDEDVLLVQNSSITFSLQTHHWSFISLKSYFFAITCRPQLSHRSRRHTAGIMRTGIDLLMFQKNFDGWVSQLRVWAERTEQQNFALKLVCFPAFVGQRPQNEKRGAAVERWPRSNSVSHTRQTSGREWQDAQSRGSGFPAGPGLVRDPPGALCYPRTDLHDAGELPQYAGKTPPAAVLQVSLFVAPLLCSI